MLARMLKNLFSDIAGVQVKWYSHSGKKAKHTLIMWSSKCIPGYYPREMKTSVHTKTCVWLFIVLLFSSLQALSHVWLFATPRTAACQASLSITNFWSLLKPMSIKSVMLSNHLILCHPCHLLPSNFPSIRVFSSELVLRIRWPKDWNFSFSISPSNECLGQISFRIDWFEFLAVQGTLKSLLQHHSSKASILWGSAFFIVQLSPTYDY